MSIERWMLTPGSEMTTSVLIRHTGAWVKYEEHATVLARQATEAAKWSEMHSQLCLVEIQLRWCIQELMKRAPELKRGDHLARVLWDYDLWPPKEQPSETKAPQPGEALPSKERSSR